MSNGCETGPTVYRPYLRILKVQPFADVFSKAAFSPRLFKVGGLLLGRSIGAYPIELIWWRLIVKLIVWTRECENSFSVRIGF